MRSFGKPRNVIVLGLLSLAIATACAVEKTNQQLSVEELAWQQIRDGALLVDVRTQAEFDAGHLDGAILIPHDQITSRLSELGDDKSRKIVLYCRSGRRASIVKQQLEGLGFQSVLNAGGYEALKRAR